MFCKEKMKGRKYPTWVVCDADEREGHNSQSKKGTWCYGVPTGSAWSPWTCPFFMSKS